MKHLLLLATIFALAACGGGGSSPSSVPVVKPSVSAFGSLPTMTFQVQIPLTTTVASANSRTPQYLAPETTFLLVDLQGNTDPQFAHTFAVGPTAPGCTINAGILDCTFTGSVPAGDPTTQLWSIAAGSGLNTNGTSGPPLSVIHNVAPVYASAVAGSPTAPSCFGGGTSGGIIQLCATLNAVVANIINPSLNFGGNGPFPTIPYVSLTPVDAFGNAVYGAVITANAPLGTWSFANPFTISEGDTSGQLELELLVAAAPGPLPFPPISTSLTISVFAAHGPDPGIEIIDTATQSRTMNVSYSIPAVTLQPSEFSQLTGPWTSPAKTGTLLTVTCVPPASVAAGVNPCIPTALPL